jgi:tRNA(Ile)-lysidine synthase
MDLARHVLKFSDEHGLLPRGERVVVGVSGGPDSLCLLDLLHSLSPNLNVAVSVAHLNHGLRAEAAAEAEMVRGQAQARGLDFYTAEVDTRAHAHRLRQSLEEAARELRYAFLAQTARQAGATYIAVAHTADDQAETVLMHFLRGAGLAGLRGMLPKAEINAANQAEWAAQLDTGDHRRLWLVRPLLETRRAEVEAYCTEHDLHPTYDATNLDPRYFRNRLRHALLPELETYNPRLRAGLARNAQVLAGEYELLQGLVENLWKRVVRQSAGQVLFDRYAWLGLSVPEQRALLREAAARLLGHPRDIEFAPIESAVQFSRRAATGRSCELLGGLKLAVGYAHLRLSRPSLQPWLPEDLPLLDNSQQLAPGWQFCVTPLNQGDWSLEQIANPGTEWRTYIDAALVEGTIRLRRRLPGDSFHPLGLNGHRQKVSDCMINAKLEGALRDQWPLVVCDRGAHREDILWVAGVKTDDHFKVTAQTHTVWQMEFKRGVER